MDDLNPLDWTAGPFLSLYVVVAVAALLLIRHWSNHMGGAAPGGSTGLGVLHLAYLAAGPERAGGAALVALLEAGAAVPDDKRKLLRFDPAAPVAAEFEPFRHVRGGEADRAGFQAQFKTHWDRLRRELAERALLPDAAALARYRRWGAAILCLPLALGACKVLVGISRDRPVGILVALMLVSGGLGVLFLLRRPHCNRAGAAVLADARQHNARAARAPLPQETALAFALTGMSVLAGFDYRWAVAMPVSSSGSDSSSSDSGGGDGGGGCGGCSA